MEFDFPTSSPTFSLSRSDVAIAGAQLCSIRHPDSDPVGLVQCVSRELCRPVVPLHLDMLPYEHPFDPNDVLTPDQATLHSLILRNLALAEHPDEKIFTEDWDWVQTGQLCTVSSFSYPTTAPRAARLPFRMAGDEWVAAAVFATASRLWDEKEIWDRISGLPRHFIEHCPSGSGGDVYNFGHEVGHILQLRPAYARIEGALQWAMEIDADEGSFSSMRLLAANQLKDRANEFDQTIAAVKHGRAISAFRGSIAEYWSALALDGQDVTYQKAVLCNYEIRFRVYAQKIGLQLPPSDELQHILATWLEGGDSNHPIPSALEQAFSSNPWGWGIARELDSAIPALAAILATGEITDNMAARNAELAIEGAVFFRPSLRHRLPAEAAVRPAVSRLGQHARPTLATAA